jgi:hypothetical protein
VSVATLDQLLVRASAAPAPDYIPCSDEVGREEVRRWLVPILEQWETRYAFLDHMQALVDNGTLRVGR